MDMVYRLNEFRLGFDKFMAKQLSYHQHTPLLNSGLTNLLT